MRVEIISSLWQGVRTLFQGSKTFYSKGHIHAEDLRVSPSSAKSITLLSTEKVLMKIKMTDALLFCLKISENCRNP